MFESGRKLMMKIWCSLQMIGYATCAVIYYITASEKKIFIPFFIVGRICSGLGSAFVLTPSYALVSLLFFGVNRRKDENFEYIHLDRGDLWATLFLPLCFI